MDTEGSQLNAGVRWESNKSKLRHGGGVLPYPRSREAQGQPHPNPPKESSGDYGKNAMGTLGRPAGASKKDEVRCRPAGGEWKGHRGRV